MRERLVFMTVGGLTMDGPLRVAMVGLSEGNVCGVRDYATRITEALGRLDVKATVYWCDRRADLSLVLGVREVGSWARLLARKLEIDHPDVIVLHYSAFAYGYRGIPLLVVPVLARLRQVGAPIVLILHEFVYPWHYHGFRGFVWAVTDRLVLPLLLLCSSGVVVTTEDRRAWLRQRGWFPRRPIRVLPVPSNVPLTGASTAPSEKVVGVFGFGAESVDISTVIEGMKLAAREIADVRLRLIGGPGPDSEAAKHWRRFASDAGVGLEFTGILEMDALSRAVSQVGLVMFADIASSRRGTLATSLLHGKAVIAFDGAQTWSALRVADAACLVERAPGAVASAIVRLMKDHLAREGYEQRAAAFYRSVMSEDLVACQLAELLTNVGRSRSGPGPGRLLSQAVKREPIRARSVGFAKRRHLVRALEKGIR